ncbi:MAG: glucose 1-dehydrogenase [Myxococcales bacterium]|nr:glucose 1-dehydrogenase [Myxococcales bacterium]
MTTPQTIAITGGGSGIGFDVARRYVEDGHRVVLNGRRREVLEQAAATLNAADRVALVAGDIADPDTSQRILSTATERFGGVDVLVNNAGIFRPQPFLKHSADDLARYLDIIVKGTFFASQAVVPSMQARGGGAIVNVGSMWATQAVNATPSSAYSAAKAAVHALTRNLALEFAKDGIRVNAVAPAVVETPVYDTFLTPEQRADVLPGFDAFHPLGRNGQPGDVAALIRFLASQDAGWMTGAIVPIDGGVTAGRP